MYDQDGTFNALLARLHWSQAAFAEISGVPLRTVKRWARADNHSPGKAMAIKYLELIARLVNIE